MSQDTEAFISSLKQFNEDSLSQELYIPSLERCVKFSPLTTKQQRYVIESAIDNPIINSVFNNKLVTIIEELAQEDIINIITTYDKDAILIQMRYYFINKLYKDVDISNTIDEIKKITTKLVPTKINVDGLSIETFPPLFVDEVKIINEFIKISSYNLAPSDSAEVGKILSDMYVLELIKYIVSITITESKLTLGFRTSTLDERIKIVDSLGKRIINDIQDHISDTKKTYDSMYRVNDDLDIEVTTDLFI